MDEQQRIDGEREKTTTLLRAIFDENPCAMLLVDDGACCLDANPAACTLLGYAREELRQFSLWDLVGVPAGKGAPPFWQEFLAAGTLQGEYALQAKAGVAFPAELEAVAHIAPGRHLFTIQDISEHREMERNLHDTGKLLRTVTENFPRAYLSVINPDLTVGFTNGAAFKARNLDPDSFVGLHVSDVFGGYGEEMVEQVTGAYRRAFAGEMQALELMLNDQYHALTTVPLVDEQGEIEQILAVVQNIDEQKQTEKRLRAMNARLKLALEAAGLGLYEYAVPVESDIQHSERWAEILGYTPETLPPPAQRLQWVQEQIHPDDLPQVKQAYANFEKGMTAEFSARYRMKHKSGAWIHVRSLSQALERGERGQVTRLLGVIEDVTEQQVRETELRKSNERLRALFEASPVAIVLLTPDGRVSLWSPAAEALFGWTSEEIVGQPYPTAKAPELAAEFDDFRQRVLAGKTIANLETRRRRKDGSLVDVSVNAAPVYDSEGAVIGAMGLVVDISEQKEAEAELTAHNQALAEAQTRLAQSEKLAAIGELIAGVAHELNNPLSAVVLYSQLMQRRNVDDSSRRDLQQIAQQAQRASSIVQSLLDFARRRPPERKATQVNDLVTSSLNLLSYQLRTHNITCVTELDPELPLIWLDPYQMQQVLVNLLNNAYQALSADEGAGEITVRTRIAPSRFHGPVRDRQEEVLRITVADDGPGIPPEALSRIFDPFFTTKEEGEGTGMGLSICHGIVSEHGGHLWAESKPGQGATFYIELPLVMSPDEAEDEHAPVATVRAETAGGPIGRILVVDDEVSIRRVLSQALQESGYRVDVVNSGEAALERLEQTSYDLILCDVRMPGLSGVAFYQALSTHYPTLARHIIFVTGDTISAETNRFLKENDLSYLSKPFNLQRLLALVREQSA